MSVNEQKGLWHCFVCDIGGTIIDLSVRLDGVSVNVAINDLAEKARLKPTDERPRTVARYKYKDRMGRDVMQVERVEAGSKKKFMQSHVDPSGQVVRNIKGVERVLFRLEKWHGKDEVSICEGEKCVAAMESIGIDATCNPGGAGGWLDGYATYLEGKHVDIWPDNDDAGLKWASTLVDSLEGRVASLRVLHVPSIYGDVADMVIAQGKDDALSTIGKIQDGVDRIDKGVVIPLLSASECMELYRKRMTAENDSSLDLSLWLPSFKTSVRPLLPGDMMLVLSDTGVGKTTILSNIAKSQRHLKSIFFEFELSPEPMAERFIAMDVGKTTSDVERRVRGGETFDVSGWDHVFICPESGVDLERMEEIIVRSELKLGEVPRLVLIDYIGLMGGGGSKRYERISNAAEGLKQLARRTDTIIVVASQLGRNRDRIEVELNDAKDSGSVENSAQLVIGAWRPEPDLITLKVLKQTKMTGESEITAEFNGNMQRITEKFGEFSEGAFDNEQTGGSL
tara:strand:- start:1450 stop:2979 length:1530 start_codon:yes stop_codon:yes gene_type:complete